MSAPTRWQAMARHTDLESWRGTNTLGSELFVSGLRLDGSELAGWTLHRTRVVAEAGWPRGTHTMWIGSGPESLLRVDVYEAPVRAVAHHLLVLLLLDFQAPSIARRHHAATGDVAFGGPGSAAVFARGNLVVTLSQAGRDPVDPWTHAATLDALFCARPEDAATVKWRDREPAAVGDNAAFDDAPGHHTRPQWLKVFSTTGSIYEHAGLLHYLHEQAGPVDLAVHPIPYATPRSATHAEVP